MKKINKEEKDKILLDFISQKINEITEKAKEEERERIMKDINFMLKKDWEEKEGKIYNDALVDVIMLINNKEI